MVGFWWGVPSWFVAGCLLPMSSHSGGQRALVSLLLKAPINPSWELHFHDLITSQRPHLQILSCQGLQFQHVNLGHAHSVYRNNKVGAFISFCLTLESFSQLVPDLGEEGIPSNISSRGLVFGCGGGVGLIWLKGPGTSRLCLWFSP